MDNSPGTVALDALAAVLAADLERIFGLFRSLVPPSGSLSMTAAAPKLARTLTAKTFCKIQLVAC